MRECINIISIVQYAVCFKGSIFLCIPLLYHTKVAKFTLFAVKVSMMISVAGYKPVLIDIIIRYYMFHHMHRKRKFGYPRFSIFLVC